VEFEPYTVNTQKYTVLLTSASTPREFKSREVAQKQKHNVISGFIRSLVLNTSTLAPRNGWSGALQFALC